MSASPDELLNAPQTLADPYPLYEWLRRQDPVYWSQAWQCWLVTRYDDVVEVMRDFKRFSSRASTTRLLDRLPPDALKRLGPLYEHFTTGLVRLDPPRHTRVRGITSKAFTPRVVEQSRARIERAVNELIDAFIERGRFDLIGDLAYPLPTIIFGEMFGLPLEDRQRFKAWSVAIIEFQASGLPDADAAFRSQDALLAARKWMGDLVEQRRQRPRDDLLSRLVEAEEEGDRLTEKELFSTCVTFMIGGHETTTNLIGNGMLALFQNPGELQRLRDEPGLAAQGVEEMLRYDAPTQRGHRIATADMQMCGKKIEQGQFVQAVLGAANRDPDRFEDPNRFDITRPDNKHASFGFGPHYCPGASLARIEAAIAINTMLDRLPNLRLSPDQTIAWRPNNFFRGLAALELDFDTK